MNFIKNSLLLFLLSLTLFAATLALEEVLAMYQDDTLRAHPEAIEQLIKKAQSNSDAAYLLATFYLEGSLGDKDLAQAYKWYLKAANEGDGDAMLSLGWLYYKGEYFGGSNPKEAKHWFYKAAQEGIEEANVMLDILN